MTRRTRRRTMLVASTSLLCTGCFRRDDGTRTDVDATATTSDAADSSSTTATTRDAADPSSATATTSDAADSSSAIEGRGDDALEDRPDGPDR